MQKLLKYPLLILALVYCSCKNTAKDEPLPVVSDLPVSTLLSGEPNLHISEKGMAYLSWVEYLNDTTDALVFSKLENNGWAKPKEVARGSNWFVNWADFPSLVSHMGNENALTAHWLQKSATGTYDYDVRIAQSADGGSTWNPSFVLHNDDISAEHGFVSLVALKNGQVFATWLDGRNAVGEGGDGHGHGHVGAMTLRAAFLDKMGNVTHETELDNKVCDCCQTAAVETPDGIIVAYRNRSDEENRDIFYTKWNGEKWTSPKAIHADNWHITGCPVNGPSVASMGNTVALTWFTAADTIPKVQIAFSVNAGETFAPPIRVDDGTPSGRVDVDMLDEKTAVVCWLENVGDGALIKTRKVALDGHKLPSFEVVETSPARSSGFPRMVKYGEQLLFAWTKVVGDSTVVRSGAVTW